MATCTVKLEASLLYDNPEKANTFQTGRLKSFITSPRPFWSMKMHSPLPRMPAVTLMQCWRWPSEPINIIGRHRR